MRARPVIPRVQAARDVDDALTFYLTEAGEKAALGFVDALERVYQLVGEQPETGSSRYAHELDLPGLRSRLLRGYPYIVFYVAREDSVDVWRVLHAASDIPNWLAEGEAP